MRTVGHREQQPITFSASAAQLVEGARFNDEIHRLPTGAATRIPKGVFYFRTHEEANRHADACVAQAIAEASLARS